MPPEQTSLVHDGKRKLSIEIESMAPSPPTEGQRKAQDQQRPQTPGSFWDNLSRQWLTPRALREFNRRTVWPAVPILPDRFGKESIRLVQLKRFAKRGGPDLSDLIAYPEPEGEVPGNRRMASDQSGSRKRVKLGKESDISPRGKKTSAYDAAFEQHLIDHKIYPYGYELDNDLASSVYPDNWKEIKKRLAQPRPSLSLSRFPREEFQKFRKANRQALTESKVMSKAFPTIVGTADIPSQENLLFGNLNDLTDGSITKARPDFYDGSWPSDLDENLRKELGPYIVPSTNTAAPCLPNFFTEGKGPDGRIPVGENQVLYDGALGARGIHELRSYVNPATSYDNNAYTITSTYHSASGLLVLYTSHPTPSEDLTISSQYRMTELKAFRMTSDPKTFRRGASALRNARDWAKEKRDEVIAAANSKALDMDKSGIDSSTRSFTSISANSSANPELETSADELAPVTDTIATSDQRNPVKGRKVSPLRTSSHRPSRNKSAHIKRMSGRGR